MEPTATEVVERPDSIPRITDYQPHEKQARAHAAFLVDGYKRGTLFWGRQVGKSLWSVKHLEMAAVHRQGQYFIVFRTHKHAKDVMWRQYLHAIPKALIADTNSTELVITFNYVKGAFFFPGVGWQYIEHDPNMPPSTIQLLGSDYALDHTGRKAHGMIFDEYQDQDPQNWETVYKHYFTTTQGWACFMGTARGYNHWYDRLQFAKARYQKALEGGRKTWYYLEATWRDNPATSEEWYTQEREEADETGQLDTFLQEVELQFRTAAGSVYPMFDRKIHVLNPDGTREDGSKIPIPYDTGTLFVVWDFGWVEGHPTAINFVLVENDKMFVIDEIHGTQITMDDAIEMIRMKAGHRMINTVIADSARPDLIEIARSKGLPVVGAPKKQGSVPAGITLMGAKLKPKIQLLGTPEPDMYFTSNNPKTIYQLENYRYRENKADRPVNDLPIKMHDDHPDALRYLLLWLKYGYVKNDKPLDNIQPKFNSYGLL